RVSIAAHFHVCAMSCVRTFETIFASMPVHSLSHTFRAHISRCSLSLSLSLSLSVCLFLFPHAHPTLLLAPVYCSLTFVIIDMRAVFILACLCVRACMRACVCVC